MHHVYLSDYLEKSTGRKECGEDKASKENSGENGEKEECEEG